METYGDYTGSGQSPQWREPGITLVWEWGSLLERLVAIECAGLSAEPGRQVVLASIKSLRVPGFPRRKTGACDTLRGPMERTPFEVLDGAINDGVFRLVRLTPHFAQDDRD